MKERTSKRDVVSSRNILSGELVPVVAFHLPPVNMKSNVYDIIFLGDLKVPGIIIYHGLLVQVVIVQPQSRLCG